MTNTAMASGSGKSDKPAQGKSFRVPDHELWLKVAESVTPLVPSRADALSAASQFVNEQTEKPAADHKFAARKRAAPAAPYRARETPAKPIAPAPGQFDRRTRQKLTRGNVDIEARLDLHGHSAAQAYGELLSFLTVAKSRGLRTVLVITGKGCSPYARHTLHGSDHFHTPERQGRLRRLVPEWLNESMFRIHVSGFQPAHPRHGGGGAFYVRLRR